MRKATANTQSLPAARRNVPSEAVGWLISSWARNDRLPESLQCYLTTLISVELNSTQYKSARRRLRVSSRLCPSASSAEVVVRSFWRWWPARQYDSGTRFPPSRSVVGANIAI